MTRLSAEERKFIASEPFSEAELDQFYRRVSNIGGGRWERRILGNIQSLESALATARAERQAAARFAQLFAVFRADHEACDRVRGIPSYDAVEEAYAAYRDAYRAARENGDGQ